METTSSNSGSSSQMTPRSASSSSTQWTPGSTSDAPAAIYQPIDRLREWEPHKLYPPGTDIDAVAESDGHFTYVPVAVSALPGVFHADRRRIIIAIAGECNDTDDQNAMASKVVYFGPGVKNNLVQILEIDGVIHTSVYAELKACEAALCRVWWAVIKPEGIRKLHRLCITVVIKTSSGSLFRAMTEQVFQWEVNKWKFENGQPVEHVSMFKRLHDQVRILNRLGMEVLFWLVSEEKNRVAQELAEQKLYQEFPFVFP